MQIIDWLTEFGLTNQEATIYITLQTEGVLTGYEVSKLTGISRSNAYTALANLTEKGASNLIEGEKKLYSPVPVEEFCASKLRRLEKTAGKIRKEMPERRAEYQGYVTIQGRENILDHMINMIMKAEKRIYLSMHKAIIGELEEYLAEALKRDLKIVIITNGSLDLPGATVYPSDKRMNEIRLITDSSRAVTGDIKDHSSTCLYSSKENLVELLKDSLTNEIELIKIRGDR
ncbi:MAG: helix-turn-helix domain-containing protein [Sphaerochaetaceae bacterium]|nr:helix-turn-helix domain-containing protein [Sphaerochaetaceae bacterium]